jgi:hypothetical protein
MSLSRILPSARRRQSPAFRRSVLRQGRAGRIETLAGAPLTYGKPGFKNDGFLAWGRRPAA